MMDKQLFVNLLIFVVIVIPFLVLSSYLIMLPDYFIEKRRIEKEIRRCDEYINWYNDKMRRLG